MRHGARTALSLAIDHDPGAELSARADAEVVTEGPGTSSSLSSTLYQVSIGANGRQWDGVSGITNRTDFTVTYI